MRLQLPEVDRDHYRTSLGVSATDYSLRKAREFRQVTFKDVEFEGANSFDSSTSQSAHKSSSEIPQTQTTKSSD
jgi:hypothetical protein